MEPGHFVPAFVRLAILAPEPLVERAFKDGARWEDLIELRNEEETVAENPIVLLLEGNHFPRLEWLWTRGLDRLKDTFTADLAYTPLIDAVLAGDAVGVRWLIGKGVDVNAHAEFAIGNTALEKAVSKGSLEIVRSLIRAGANPNIPTWMWRTAVDRLACDIKEMKHGTPEHANAMAMWAVVEPAARRFPKPVYPDGSGPGVWPPKL